MSIGSKSLIGKRAARLLTKSRTSQLENVIQVPLHNLGLWAYTIVYTNVMTIFQLETTQFISEVIIDILLVKSGLLSINNRFYHFKQKDILLFSF